MSLARTLQKRGVAGAVGLGLVVALGPGGCLWAPDINESTPPQAVGLQVDWTLVKPSADGIVTVTAPTTFGVAGAVTDPGWDVVTQLQYTWYVDYAADAPDINKHPYRNGPGTVLKTLLVDPCSQELVKEWLLTSGQVHSLELLISQAAVATDEETGLRILPPGSADEDNQAYVVVTWILDVEATCPGSPQ